MAHSSRCTAHNSLAVLALKAGMPLQPGGAVCEQHCGPIDMHFYSPADSEQYINSAWLAMDPAFIPRAFLAANAMQ